MIKLSTQALAAHSLVERLSNPPTHAKVGYYAVTCFNKEASKVHVGYELGTVDNIGNFTADPHIAAVYSIAVPGKMMVFPENLNISPDSIMGLAYAEHTKKQAQFEDLIGQGFLTERQLDIFFGTYESKLLGIPE